MKSPKFVSWQVRLVVGLLVVKAIVGVYAFGDVQAASRWVSGELEVVGRRAQKSISNLVSSFFNSTAIAKEEEPEALAGPLAPTASSTGIVISQLYTYGGGTGATYTNDYVELYNRGTSTVSLSGWSIQYASASGTSWTVGNLSGSIAPGKYYLIKMGGGATGSALPTEDVLTSTLNMAQTAGKIALVNSTTALSLCGSTASQCTSSSIVDLVGYGTTAQQYEGTSYAPVPSATNALFRSNSGCKETDTNSADFSAAAASPRNSSSTATNCNAVASAVVYGSVPSNATSGTAVSPAITVKVRDANGIDINSDLSITLSSTTDNAISGTLTASASTGTATFSNVVFGTAGSQYLTASATGVTSATATITVAGGTPTPSPSPSGSPTATPTPAPDTTISTKPSTPSASASATFEFTADIAGSTFECQIDSGSWESCTSPKVYTSLSDGSHTFGVRATADSQTDATPATYTWTVDSTAPETSITVAPPGATYKTSASISFSATDTGGVGVASYECKLDAESYAACTSPKSYTGLASGSHTFYVRALDTLGNTDATPATVTWSVGTGAFTSGNIAALVVASSSGSNTTADIVELNKTTASQVGVQVIEIPGSGSTPLRFSGSSTANAYLSRSNDGSLLLFTGHNSTDTVTNVTGIALRGVGAFTSGGLFSIPATYSNVSAVQTRGATTRDNTNFYFADAGGLFTNGTSIASPIGSYRGAKSFGGVVYLGQSSASAAPVGTVSALTGGAFTALPGLPNGTANDFYFVSSGENGPVWDVLYIVSASSATAGTIAKYSLVSGTWTANGSYTTTFGGFGLTAEDFGTGARLYVSTGSGATSGNSVIRVTDTTGYNSTMAVTTADNVTLFTAASGTSIKGVSLAPQSGLNSAPVITAASGVTRQQGSVSSNSTIATVGDLDTGAGSPVVTVTSSNPSNGVTISNIVNTNGTITADIVADCGTSNATFTLQASDGTATSTASFTVTVTDNTAPTLAYSNSSVAATGSTTISPTSGPTDNGSVTSVAIQSQGTFTGTISVDSAGVISVSDAGPAGSHTITVSATDNCGAVTSASFTLLVSNTTPPDTTITAQPPTLINSTSGIFEFTADKEGSTFECRLNSGSYSACTSPKTVTATANASNTFYVRAKDADGVYDPTPASYTWTVDTTAPDVTLVSAPAATTISTTATFSFTSTDSGAVFQCSFDSAPYSSCASPKSYTGLANGSHTFSVKSVDGAGNSSSPTSSTFTVSKPSAFGSSHIVVFKTGAATSSNTTGSIVELDRTTAGQTPVQSIDLDGTGSLALRFSGSGTSTGYLSRSNDGSSLLFTGHSSTNTASNANTLLTRGVGAFTSAADFSMPTTYTGASGNQTRSATTVDGSNYFITDTGGLYTNGAALADPLGNFRAAKSFGGTVYVGSTNVLLSPVVTIASATGGTATSLPGLPNASGSETDFYLISSGENGAVYDVLYYLSASGASAGTVYKYSLVDGSWVSNGTYTTTFGGFSLVAEDSGAGAKLYVTTGSGATAANSLIRLADASGYNQTIAVTTADNVTLYTAAAGTSLKGVAFTPTDWVNSAPTMMPASVSKAKGSYFATTTIGHVGDLDTGAAGVAVSLTSAMTSNGVTVANIQKTGGTVTADIATSCTATDASFTFEVSDGTATATATLNVTVTADTGPTLTYSDATVLEGDSTTVSPATGPSDNGAVASIVIQSQGTYTGTISVDAAGVVSISNAGLGGQHTITVRATDTCGTYTDATFVLTVTDVTPPETTITADPGSLSNNSADSFSFTSSEGNSTFECSVDGGTFAACTSPKEVTGLAAGSHTFEVRAIDAANNMDATPASYSWTVDLTAPTLTPEAPLGNTSSTSSRVWTVTASDANGISGVNLTYQVGGTPPPFGEGSEPSFGPPANVACVAGGGAGQFNCTIPGQPSGAVVSYYVTATDGAGNTTVAPSQNAPNVYVVGSATVPAGTYSNLQLDGNVTLAGPITVTGTMTISGIISTGSNVITLGPDATISGAGPTSYIVGTVVKIIGGTGSFTIPVGGSTPPPGASEGLVPSTSYAPVDVNVTAVVGASALTVSTTASTLPGATSTSSLARYWDIVESGDVTADLTFHYLDADVVGTESSYRVMKKSESSIMYFTGGTVDSAANTFSAPNVSTFSGWSAGAFVPTAAGAEVEGRVMSSNGSALKNVSVMVSGGNLLEPMIVKTNQFGAYRFEGLATGETYVIQVVSGRYTFRNPAKVISLYESISNENFVADTH